MASADSVHERVLILAPIGRDASALAEVLRRAGLESMICGAVPQLITALSEGGDAVLVAEEAVFGPQSEDLVRWVEQQPPWSDMPFVVLTSRQDRPGVMAWRQNLLVGLRNASLLERPLDVLTITSALGAAVRSRARQYEVRSYIIERAAAANRLEEAVEERTRELRMQMAEREKVEVALRQSQKMEAVGQLTGGLAHDFNNLLAGISGSLELLQARLAQGRTNDLGHYITAALGASKRAAALTHRLLAFARRQTLAPKPIDVNRLIAGMEELIRRTVGPEVVVGVVGAIGLWPTLVDPNQLENALLNLCINARDAMPDGGKLTIETANRWLDDREARTRDLPPGQYVSLCVSDTGTGMTDDVIRRAFDPFFTTKPLGMGTGLGLSMIYGFVQQSGGQARIYSEVGEGTMVCLYLPRHLGPTESSEMSAEPVIPPVSGLEPTARQDETVLVIDDEVTVRMLVTEIVEGLGYTAIEAAEGTAGLQVLRSNTRIDLLITDVGLPGMNGRQVADAGRALRPDMKVLFITGYAENAVLSHGHLEPGMHVLTKPFPMEALADRIKDLIGRR